MLLSIKLRIYKSARNFKVFLSFVGSLCIFSLLIVGPLQIEAASPPAQELNEKELEKLRLSSNLINCVGGFLKETKPTKFKRYHSRLSFDHTDFYTEETLPLKKCKSSSL